MGGYILAAFDGATNISRMVTERLDIPSDCRMLLTDDRCRSVEILSAAIKKHEPACIVLLGQKPVISDKIAVEASAKLCGEVRRTNMDVTTVAELIKSTGYKAYISDGCGTSYCNHIYWHALGAGVNAVFLHVPCKKNVSDINALVKAVEAVLEGLAGVPAML